jgi:hypothetical protein
MEVSQRRGGVLRRGVIEVWREMRSFDEKSRVLIPCIKWRLCRILAVKQEFSVKSIFIAVPKIS